MSIIAETPWAIVEFVNDELLTTQKNGVVDCPKIRFMTEESHSIGAFSWDVKMPSGERRELANIKGARESAEGGSPIAGHLRIQLNDGEGGGDIHMARVVDLFHDHIRSYVPIYAPNLGDAQFPSAIALRARANGKLVCAEGDGSQPLIANRDAVGEWETFEVIAIE